MGSTAARAEHRRVEHRRRCPSEVPAGESACRAYVDDATGPAAAPAACSSRWRWRRRPAAAPGPAFFPAFAPRRPLLASSDQRVRIVVVVVAAAAVVVVVAVVVGPPAVRPRCTAAPGGLVESAADARPRVAAEDANVQRRGSGAQAAPSSPAARVPRRAHRRRPPAPPGGACATGKRHASAARRASSGARGWQRVCRREGCEGGGSVASTGLNHSTPVLVAAAPGIGLETLHPQRRCVELEEADEARTSLTHSESRPHANRGWAACAWADRPARMGRAGRRDSVKRRCNVGTDRVPAPGGHFLPVCCWQSDQLSGRIEEVSTATWPRRAQRRGRRVPTGLQGRLLAGGAPFSSSPGALSVANMDRGARPADRRSVGLRGVDTVAPRDVRVPQRDVGQTGATGRRPGLGNVAGSAGPQLRARRVRRPGSPWPSSGQSRRWETRPAPSALRQE